MKVLFNGKLKLKRLFTFDYKISNWQVTQASHQNFVILLFTRDNTTPPFPPSKKRERYFTEREFNASVKI